MNHLEGRGPSSLEEIPGLVWKKDGQIVTNEARPWNDLDKLPFLPYDLVDMDEYITERSIRWSLTRSDGFFMSMPARLCFQMRILRKHLGRSEEPGTPREIRGTAAGRN